MASVGITPFLQTLENVMAKRTVVELIDDLDGGPADERLTFSFDGQGYEIDLSADNAQEFRAMLEVYAKAGREVTASRQSGEAASEPRSFFDEVDQRAVRAWASANGIKVSPRGRLSRKVVEQYRAAGH